ACGTKICDPTTDCVRDAAGGATCVCKAGYQSISGKCVGPVTCPTTCGSCPTGATCTVTSSNVPYCICPPGYGMGYSSCISGATPTASSTSITFYDQTNHTITPTTYTVRLPYNSCRSIPAAVAERALSLWRVNGVPGGAGNCASVYGYTRESCQGPPTWLPLASNGTGIIAEGVIDYSPVGSYPYHSFSCVPVGPCAVKACSANSTCVVNSGGVAACVCDAGFVLQANGRTDLCVQIRGGGRQVCWYVILTSHLSPLLTSHHFPPLSTSHLSPLLTSHHFSPLTTSHLSPLITSHRFSPLTASHLSPLITSHRFSPLTASHLSPLLTSHHFSPLSTSHLSPLLTSHHFSPLTTYHLSPLLTSHHFSPLTTSHLSPLLTSHHFSPLTTSHLSPLSPLTTSHLLPLLTSHHFSPLTTSHLSPLLTSHHFSPLTTSHLSPLLTSHRFSPLTTSHLSPLLTSHHFPPLTTSHLSARDSHLSGPGPLDSLLSNDCSGLPHIQHHIVSSPHMIPPSLPRSSCLPTGTTTCGACPAGPATCGACSDLLRVGPALQELCALLSHRPDRIQE
ncbi:unnamed protein product, partial [Closterium sp. NIES-64]